MRSCEIVNPIQVFAPHPSKTVTLTLTAGTATWTPPNNTRVYMFFPSTAVVQKLNANTTGLTFDATVLAGPFGINSATSSITFTGTAGATVVIEAD